MVERVIAAALFGFVVHGPIGDQGAPPPALGVPHVRAVCECQRIDEREEERSRGDPRGARGCIIGTGGAAAASEAVDVVRGRRRGHGRRDRLGRGKQRRRINDKIRQRLEIGRAQTG